MIRVFVIALFFISTFVLPWWVVLALGTALIVYFRALLSVVLGGLIMDTLYGVPLAVFFDVSYFYTGTFFGLAISAHLLRTYLLE